MTLEEQVAQLEADLLAVRTAINVVLTTSQSYTLDTGQTRQTVTRADLSSLRLLRKEIQSELDAARAKLTGGAGVFVRPDW